MSRKYYKCFNKITDFVLYEPESWCRRVSAVAKVDSRQTVSGGVRAGEHAAETEWSPGSLHSPGER